MEDAEKTEQLFQKARWYLDYSFTKTAYDAHGFIPVVRLIKPCSAYMSWQIFLEKGKSFGGMKSR